jgi:hypothetical protein
MPVTLLPGGFALLATGLSLKTRNLHLNYATSVATFTRNSAAFARTATGGESCVPALLKT